MTVRRDTQRQREKAAMYRKEMFGNARQFASRTEYVACPPTSYPRRCSFLIVIHCFLASRNSQGLAYLLYVATNDHLYIDSARCCIRGLYPYFFDLVMSFNQCSHLPCIQLFNLMWPDVAVGHHHHKGQDPPKLSNRLGGR